MAGGRGPQRGGFRVLAPLLDVPVLVDEGGAPGCIDRHLALHQRQREQRRAAQGRRHMQRRQRQGSKRRQRLPDAGEQRRVLANRHHSLRQNEPPAEPRFCPGEHRPPGGVLPLDERLRTVGPVEQQVVAGIGGDIVGDLAGAGRHRVDRGIGDASERHGRRVDLLALRGPFGGDAAGDLFLGKREEIASRRLDRSAVELNRMQAVLLPDDADLLVEALRQFAPRQGPGALDRIGGAAGLNIAQQVAHQASSLCSSVPAQPSISPSAGTSSSKRSRIRAAPAAASRARG